MLKQIGDYEVQEEMGSGAFGIVRKVKHLETNSVHAVKILDKSQLRAEDLAESIAMEIVFM